MQPKPLDQMTISPLFAEWKLTDAAREFRETMGIPDTAPTIRIPLHNSLTGAARNSVTNTPAILNDTLPKFLPLTITGWQRIRKGSRFFFGLEGAVDPSSLTPGLQTPVHIPITKPAGYLTTLRRMHRHGIPLSNSESLIAKALAAVFDRRPQKNHRCRPLLLATDATRITLPDGGIYDLPLGRHLTQEEAASEDILRESYAVYRKARGYECTAPAPLSTAEPEIYLTADLHLGHRNAIHYYCRPFLPDEPDTMDFVLTKNWNNIIRPDDSVIFAGDFTYKAETETTEYYRSHLNGTVTWIKGNHDTGLEDTCLSHTIMADGRTFLIIHNPKHIPTGYQGWVIHGHTHNARLGKYPFISFANKTVNISTDVTGYHPVPLSEILTLIREGEKTGRTEPILIRQVSQTLER